MNTLTLTVVSVATFLSITGCGGAGPSDRSASESSPADATPPPVGPTVSISGFVHASDGTLLPGATVCARSTDTSAVFASTTSGDEGSFTLSGVPANQQVMVVFRRETFFPSLRAITTGTSDIMLPENENAMLPAVNPQMFLGMTANPTRGQIAFAVTSPSAQAALDVSVTMTGFGGGSEAPVYFDASGSPAVGAGAGQSGGFVNVPPDYYVLRFGHTGATCTVSGLYGYPATEYQNTASGEAVVVVPVLAGYVTSPVDVTCVSAP